ncbi:hypothetical protein LTR37_011798 [Vermiconidia calcicola]|uniref:Uncharacterized protein n=1 Tax=Vermiconidia calcicola TaxID=1690605 RepID=A0ACC3N168_9PEZI|nr:hypothetical protein LTR37_011798 [Vermiconidia calcicola]
MALNASLNKFKNELSDAATRNAQYSRPTSTAPARTGTPKLGDGAKRTHGTAFSNSQPAPAAPTNTLHSGGAGGELMTQVWNSVNYLKEKSPQSITFDYLISYLSLPVDAQKNIPLIKRILSTHDRVTYLSRSESGTGKESFQYRPFYPITNAEELKEYMGIAAQRTATGIPVKDLKDGWPDCAASLDRLEREGFILVTRQKKDNAPKTVYPDSPSYHILNPISQLPQKADTDFVDIWAKTKLPGSEIELRNALEAARLTPTSQVKEVQRGMQKKKERRKVNRKGGKTTNNHMLGILKDYTRK